MHVSLFSVRHLFLDLFGFIEVSSLWQMSPLPHYHTIFQSKNGEYVYWFSKSNLVYQACPIYWPLSQFTADAPPHTLSHSMPSQATCFHTSHKMEVFVYSKSAENTAAFQWQSWNRSGNKYWKIYIWQMLTSLKKKSSIWVILTQFSNSCEIKFANSSWRWTAG